MSRRRPLKPLVGSGPVARFARDLRELHAGRTGRSYRDFGSEIHCGASSICEALGGERLPSADVLGAMLRGYAVDDAEFARWQAKRDQAEQDARAFIPAFLARCTTIARLAMALRDLMAAQGTTSDGVHDQLTQVAVIDPTLAWAQLPLPTPADLDDALQGRAALARELVIQIVRGSGGTEADAKAWSTQWDRIETVRPAVSTPPSPSAPRWRDRWRWVLVAAAGLVVIPLSLYALRATAWSPALVVMAGTYQPSCSSMTPTLPAVADERAQAELLGLCTRVLRAPDRPVDGDYTYTWVQVRSRDNPGSQDDIVNVHDERSWVKDDREGQRTTLTTTGRGRTEPPHVEHYAIGKFPVVIEQPSDDPVTLAGQIDGKYPLIIGPVNRLRAVAEIYTVQWLSRAQRVAVLRMLASTPGLTSRDQQVDPWGRVGLAISADFPVPTGSVIREILLFDNETGTLLSHETVAVPDAANTHGAVPTSLASVVYLEQTRTDHPG